MGFKDRLARLEQAIRVSSPQPIPAMYRVLFKATERRKAAARGDDLPPYTDEETEELRNEDLKTVSGGGVVGYLRGSGGWADDKSRAFLDRLQDHARKRLDGRDAMD